MNNFTKKGLYVNARAYRNVHNIKGLSRLNKPQLYQLHIDKNIELPKTKTKKKHLLF